MSGTLLFISDLHLEVSRPETTALYRDFLDGPARDADGLYILGDLFEMWVGDDDHSPEHEAVLAPLCRLTGDGVPVWFLPGNRDFLAGEGFAARSGCRLLRDPSLIELAGQPALLVHGDAYCTDDAALMAFRAETRNEAFRNRFLARPLAERIAYGVEARACSEAHKRQAATEIMDVNPSAIAAAHAEHGARLMVQGHTHRPAIHVVGDTVRAVLGDWHATGSCLRVDADGTLRLQRIHPDLRFETIARHHVPA